MCVCVIVQLLFFAENCVCVARERKVISYMLYCRWTTPLFSKFGTGSVLAEHQLGRAKP